MSKIFYEAPEFEVLDVMVEAGFLLSVNGDVSDDLKSDYGDGGWGSEME